MWGRGAGTRGGQRPGPVAARLVGRSAPFGSGEINRIASGGSEGVAGSSPLILISPTTCLYGCDDLVGRTSCQVRRSERRCIPHTGTRLRHQKKRGTSVHQACTAPAPRQSCPPRVVVCARARLNGLRVFEAVTRPLLILPSCLSPAASPQVGIFF